MHKFFLSKLMFFSVLLFVTSVFAQDDLNKLDANGRKHGPWKGVYEDSKRPRYEGTFENGKETGKFVYYDDTKAGTIVATREFSPKENSAYTIFYNQKKNKISEGKMVNKLHEGEWIYYHENSANVMTREQYKSGKLHGLRSVYFPNGKIAEEINYQNGIRQGAYRKYTPTGIILEESTYNKGEMDGPAIFRGSDGKIASEGKFVNGLKRGIWKFYLEGKLVREEKHPLVKKFKKSPPRTE